MPAQIFDFLRFLTRTRSQERHDLQAAAELDWARARYEPQLPAGLSLEWLGTSGFALRCAGYTLLIDPYVTRVPLATALGRERVRPDQALIDRYLPRADAILIGHTHFDHALDAPAVARRDGCSVYGSRSLVNLMAARGMAEQAVEVEVYREYELGPFRVSFVPSVHSKLALGLAVPSSGDITCEHVDGLACSEYRCGQVYGLAITVEGFTIYHQGSADLIEDAVRHRDVDLFLAGIAGRGFTDDFIGRAIRSFRPKVVLPHHHDNFFIGLDDPLRMSLNVNLCAFVEEVRAASRGVELITAERLRELSAS
ncbi:MBL fold metallo-hydrolase [Pseudenhygromyxa sp. WMMC2535]|uniref:MBL fold metallo-hydrolase n=1 Tax=Pseudenhygromyxa sp. WMMC2535 TaxID=2712867 RepID=UPI0015538EDD|nr:MBL fold metallo-hydrolase [Pseudenhygromyxa sp. WMMC2535]NVB38873.1 MBL fold metallo-hydrolase [Pseudenhygromyxa sp. WMMC2535]